MTSAGDKTCSGDSPATGQHTPTVTQAELLEAGERLANVADNKMATVKEMVEAVRDMRAAIAKAKGETQ